MTDSWYRSLRDAADILRHARNPVELAKALLPNAWLERKVLNQGAPRGPELSAAEAAKTLRELGHALKAEVIDVDGHVDYERLRGSKMLADLQRASGALLHVDGAAITGDDARIAFWTNVYNVLAIHGVLAMEVRSSVMEIPSFFAVVSYRVGDSVLTLDDIEHGVLRRNAPHPATKSRLFDDDDPRLALCPSRLDARIHAALVCASTSCPAIAFYEASQLDAQLDLASDHYVGAELEIDDEAKVIRVPIIFRYYERDFGRRAGVRLFLLNHSSGPQHDALQNAFDAGYALDYQRYDWSLNSIG